MSRDAIWGLVKVAAAKTAFIFQKLSPEICLVGGTAAVVTGTVFACKATMKLPDILDETKEEINCIHATVDNKEIAYSEQDAKKDLTRTYVRCGLKVAKAYVVPFILEAGGLGLIFSGHVIQKNRNADLALAYAGLDKAFREYRKRVDEKYGEGSDKAVMYNVREEAVEETVKTDKGKEKTVKKTIQVGEEPLSLFARCFERGCPGWVSDPDMRILHLQSVQRTMNDQLKVRGFLWLNEVYEALGFPQTRLGQMYGWVYDPKDPRSSCVVSFDITNIHRQSVRDFRNGYEEAMWLEFNVDGIITDRVIDMGLVKDDKAS